MKTPKNNKLTPVELEIMKVLWRTGPAMVQKVRAMLPGEPAPAYTTVQTMLNVLLRKGRVKRVLKGQAYEYAPVVTKQAAVRQAVRDLLDGLFGGSAEDLVMNLVQNRHLTAEELANVIDLLSQSQKERGNERRD